MTFFSGDRGGLGSGEGLTITKYWKGVALSESQYLFFWCFKSNQLTGSLEWYKERIRNINTSHTQHDDQESHRFSPTGARFLT